MNMSSVYTKLLARIYALDREWMEFLIWSVSNCNSHLSERLTTVCDVSGVSRVRVSVAQKKGNSQMESFQFSRCEK